VRFLPENHSKDQDGISPGCVADWARERWRIFYGSAGRAGRASGVGLVTRGMRGGAHGAVRAWFTGWAGSVVGRLGKAFVRIHVSIN
jgi:hypothetical protein